MIYQEVIDYWRSKGFDVRARCIRGNEKAMLEEYGSLLYDIVKDSVIERTIAIEFFGHEREDVYYINDQAFYGEEILKVLKLKAFL